MNAPADRSLGDLLGDLTTQSSDLVRKEVKLLRVELDERIERAQNGMLFAVAGGAAISGGLLVLLFALVFAVAQELPMWASALIVGGIATAAGFGLVTLGGNRLKLNALKPKESIEEAEETAQMLKEELS